MALDDWHYKNKHIPGSISASALAVLDDLKDRAKLSEIVVHTQTIIEEFATPSDESLQGDDDRLIADSAFLLLICK